MNWAEIFKPEEILDYLRKSQSDDPPLTVEEVLAKHEAILDEWAGNKQTASPYRVAKIQGGKGS